MKSSDYYYCLLWNYCRKYPGMLKPPHIAIYTHAVAICAGHGFADKFNLPSKSVMKYVGMNNTKSYKKYFDDLIAAKLFFIVRYSQNQYTANMIALAPPPEGSNAMGKNTRANPENAGGKNTLASINGENSNGSARAAPGADRQNSKKIWCGQNASLIEVEVFNKPSSSSKKASAGGKNTRAFPEADLKPPTVETFRRDALKDNNFVEEMRKYLPDISTLRGWLTNFNRRLLFHGDVHKTQAEYRHYFLRWLQKVPGYKTLDPGSYKLTQDSLPNSSNNPGGNITPTEQEIANKIKALRAKQN